jgi:hypothetical protein
MVKTIERTAPVTVRMNQADRANHPELAIKKLNP